MAEAEKHEARSENLAALVAEARDMLEQARAAEAERARVAAEEAVVKASAEAAQRLKMEEELAALTLRAQADSLRIQQIQAQLRVRPAAHAPHTEEPV